jgi:hypothetical protein
MSLGGFIGAAQALGLDPADAVREVLQRVSHAGGNSVRRPVYSNTLNYTGLWLLR